MKTLVTKLTERGQVSVPSDIRRELHLKPGSRLCWERVSDHECRLYVQDTAKPKGAQAMLGFAKSFRKLRRTDDWLKDIRDGEDS